MLARGALVSRCGGARSCASSRFEKGEVTTKELDEEFVPILSVMLAVFAGGKWAQLAHGVGQTRRAGRRFRRALLGLPLALVVVIAEVLSWGAATDVRTNSGYWFLFVALGAIWLAATVEILRWLGIGFRDDAIERENRAAGWAVAGALLAGAIGYSFANFGEGTTIWTTLGPASLVLAVTSLLWAAYLSLSGSAAAIAIERDVDAGIRFAGLAVGSSLIVGRSMAGDYVSMSATFRDLAVQSWLVVPLTAVAVLVQRLEARAPSHHSRGFVAALAYVAVGVVDVASLGAWWGAAR